MLSEELDKKIRDAAHHHHPPYDETAWKGMKKLLDKHLPEENDGRRRILFFLFFFLLLGGGAWLLIDKTRADKTRPVAISEKVKSQSANEKITPAGITPVQPTTDETEKVTQIVTPVINNIPDQTPGTPGNNNNASRQITTTGNKVTGEPVVKTVNGITTGNDPLNGNPVSITPVNDAVNDKEQLTSLKPDTKSQTLTKEIIVPPGVSAVNDKKAESTSEENKKIAGTVPEQQVKEEKGIKKKTVNKKNSFFFLSVSGGPDASFTGNDKVGEMKFLGGAGIGYTYKEKFTLRTGFYSARKIYTSSPEEYHGSAWLNTYYPNLQRIEADCKVYEIPLSVSYNFKRTGKHSIFASAGVSSYLMKRETYDYYYKYYPSGPTVNKTHTTYNKNNHYFSVLSLSAGYQHNISKKVSLTAEPYFKLPLKGVGEGKVKLNSGGVLFTLSVKPFGVNREK